jgi:hypothetical protein
VLRTREGAQRIQPLIVVQSVSEDSLQKPKAKLILGEKCRRMRGTFFTCSISQRLR